MNEQFKRMMDQYKKAAAEETPYDVANGSRSWCQADRTPGMDQLANEIGIMEEEMREARIEKSFEIDLDPDVDNMPMIVGTRHANLNGYDLSVEVLQNQYGIHFWLVNDDLPDDPIRKLCIKTLNDADLVQPFINGLKQLFPGIVIHYKIETLTYQRVNFNDFIDVIYS